MDLVEVAPAYDVGEITALAGASMICWYMGLLLDRGGNPGHGGVT
jgi:agmatinase